ncbi:MAG: VOC family protein [Betaproteobacteria bacterium]|nr:VOC family protein [Betaproteobacteria bacterium]
MPLLNFGQPLGGVFQIAFIVENIRQSMQDFTARLHIGPWFASEPFTPPEARYRGRPTDLHVTLAVGFGGHMSFELIEQHNDAPSVYREIVNKRGYGFHHGAVMTGAFDQDVEKYRLLGYEAAFTDRMPYGYRIAYIDTTRDFPGMIELIEFTDSVEERYTTMYQASVGWDGTNPVRPAVPPKAARAVEQKSMGSG